LEHIADASRAARDIPAGKAFIYSETQYSNEPFATLAGEQEYVYIDGYGSDTDWAAVGEALVGKIALCIRGGGISFYVKAEEAVKAGAIGTFICNNTDGVLNMNLADYSMTAPVAALTMADAAAIKAARTALGRAPVSITYAASTGTAIAHQLSVGASGKTGHRCSNERRSKLKSC
jgi:hypothetical protein